ncbi:MAG: YigZ family protein [Clostridiales bacterium GWB2_37_7]|nr:MAG: YigZ family protein [Clostridiales bacterium GWB2_37_7]
MKKAIRMVKKYAESVFIEKKSRFISYIAPVYTEQEAADFIHTIKKKHYDASHNCSAFIIGETSSIQRSSDDGEPSGTAGVPILEVLRKECLTNTVVVVTRYFGGIMLGAGGLIRAYTQGCADAVRAAGIMKLQPYAVYSIKMDYNLLDKIQHEINKKAYILADTQYLEIVTLKILAEPEKGEELQNDLIQWTNANALIEYQGIEVLKIDELTQKII